MKKQHVILTMIVLLSTSSTGFAFDWFSGRLSVGGGYGRAKPILPDSYEDTYQDGEMWTTHIKYFLNNDVSVVGSYADLEPYRRGNKGDQYRFRPIVASLRYNVLHHLPFTPYLTAGAGYSTNKHEVPGAVATKWDGFTWQGGLGVEVFITEGTSLGAEALYHHFDGNGGDSNSPYRLVSAVGMMNIYFGPGPSQKRTEEALQRQKEETERAQAEAEKTKAEALAAQQATTNAQAQTQQAQAQLQQAQAEVEHVKQMVASKEIAPIVFKTGSSDLLATSDPTLDKVAEVVKKYPNLKLRVEGHTDSTGGSELNQRLSQKRADSVRDYLVKNDGVPAEQISAVGFGESRPIASNDTAEGRSQNRRVEFIFTLQ